MSLSSVVDPAQNDLHRPSERRGSRSRVGLLTAALLVGLGS
jgi:hypothetical protein